MESSAKPVDPDSLPVDPDTVNHSWLSVQDGAPIYDLFRREALREYNKGAISFASLQQCLNLAHILEADIAQRNVASIAVNRAPDGTLAKR